MQKEKRCRKSKKKRYLFLLDFDGTIFDTLTDVESAYYYAIEQVFREEGATIYLKEGGLRNRAPSEVVEDLLKHDGMLVKATRSFQEAESFLTETIPCIVPLSWDANNPERSITELIIRQKLRLLLTKIGPDWPKPCKGIPEFLDSIAALRIADGICIDLGILSAGHESFIREAFKAQNLKCPELLATDDNFRVLGLTPEYRVKPAKALFDYAFDLWRKAVDKKGVCELNQVIYAGDCAVRDGGLALNADIPFIWFNPNKTTTRCSFPLGSSQISSWAQMARFLHRYEVSKMMKLGRSTAEIFSPFQ